MTGTSPCATMWGTACAASSLLTVTRTSSLPASCRARTCAAVVSTTAVSVLVIGWTAIGWAPPTFTPPTSTTTLRWRAASGTAGISGGRAPPGRWLEDLVPDHDVEPERVQHHLDLHGQTGSSRDVRL